MIDVNKERYDEYRTLRKRDHEQVLDREEWLHKCLVQLQLALFYGRGHPFLVAQAKSAPHVTVNHPLRDPLPCRDEIIA